jgi:hypothetical protein
VIAYWHHAPYTMGNHTADQEMELVKIRENFLPILERFGVDLVLRGHSHYYERSRLMKGGAWRSRYDRSQREPVGFHLDLCGWRHTGSLYHGKASDVIILSDI